MNPTPTELSHLVQIAALLIDNGITDCGANLLAYVLAQPQTHTATYQHADSLFDDLETTICPRVIWDARDYAQTATWGQVQQDLAKWRAEHAS